MDGSKDGIRSMESGGFENEEEMELRRGPWTVEEDITLINYIAAHGEGRWNSLARAAGLKRTGKSCRLRWLNYLRPDVRRGNITLEEQLLILELHSQWGNRWSKIAQHLPGRTDNEIKNYWRTRVQKHAKQLKCDVNSKQFKDTMRYLWMPRLVERIQAAASSGAGQMVDMAAPAVGSGNDVVSSGFTQSYVSENSSCAGDSFGAQVSPASELTDCYNMGVNEYQNPGSFGGGQMGFSEPLPSPLYNQGLDFPAMEQSYQWFLDAGDTSGNLWNVDDVWFSQQ